MLAGLFGAALLLDNPLEPSSTAYAIPVALLDTFLVAWPSRRYRSALVGIAVHSVQSVVLTLLLLSLVLR